MPSDAKPTLAPTKSDWSDPPSRREWITDTLFELGELHIEQIANALHVSTATAYRDAQTLENQGIVIRSKGFLRAIAPSTAELPAAVRAKRQLDEKRTLAHAAAKLVSPGDVIILDDSTTNVPLIPILKHIKSLTIITNSLYVAREFSEVHSIQLILLGGNYMNWADSFYGTHATEMVKDFRADISFMSDAAVWAGAIYNPKDFVVNMKRAILGASHRKVLMLDHNKFSRAAWQRTAPLEEFTTIFTTTRASSKDVENLRKYCSDVRVV